MALSNQYSDCEILNLDPADPQRGPFIATQDAVAAEDPSQEENLYLLRRDGVWIEYATHVLIPESERVPVEFDALADIIKLLAALPPQPTILRAATVDQSRLAEFLQHVAADGGMLAHIQGDVARYKAQQTQSGAGASAPNRSATNSGGVKSGLPQHILALAVMTLVALANFEIPLAAAEADQLREELRQLKQDYEQRIRKIEDQLQRLEAPPPPPTNTLTVTVITSSNAVESAASNTNAAAAARQFADEQFARDTESHERSAGMSTAPFRDRVEQVLQDFVDISGYFRAGYGRDNEGGPQVGFQAPGAFSKYRLGNEAENYGEIGIGKNFYVPGLFSLDEKQRPDGTPTGPIARVQTRISIYNPYQDLLSSDGTSFGLPEAWAAIGNVIDAQPSMKFWAGNRYYRRHDIHISDFFYYNMSGAGGGVEDIELPFGKLAFAWIGAASQSGFSDVPEPDPSNEAGFSKANWDLRLYDVPLPLGKGEFGIVYARADSGVDAAGNSASDSDGVAFTLLHTRDKFIGEDGVNKFSLQFGTGAAKTFTSGFETVTLTNGVFILPDATDSWRFRVTESFTANVNDHFSIGPAFVYQLTDDGSQGRVHWLSTGVRPILHFNKYLSLAFEGGVDWVKDDLANTSGNLYKFTLAPQVSLGGRFMSRPVIRAFVTYAHWSDDFVGQVGGNDYLNQDEGLTYGVQMEVWW